MIWWLKLSGAGVRAHSGQLNAECGRGAFLGDSTFSPECVHSAKRIWHFLHTARCLANVSEFHRSRLEEKGATRRSLARSQDGSWSVPSESQAHRWECRGSPEESVLI